MILDNLATTPNGTSIILLTYMTSPIKYKHRLHMPMTIRVNGIKQQRQVERRVCIQSPVSSNQSLQLYCHRSRNGHQ